MAWLFVMVGISVAGWLWAGHRVWVQGRPLLIAEPRPPVSWGLIDVCLAQCLLMAGQAAAVVAAVGAANTASVLSDGVATLDSTDQLRLTCWLAAASLVATLVSLLVVLALNGWDWADVGLSRWLRGRRLAGDALVGLVGFALLAGPIYGLQWYLVERLGLKSEHPLIEQMRSEGGGTALLVAIFAAVLVAPWAEEYLFRGLLQGWLEKLLWQRPLLDQWLFGGRGQRRPLSRRLAGVPPQDAPEGGERDDVQDAERGDWVQPQRHGWLAIMGSALPFALLHYDHGVDWIPLFPFAVGLGYVYQRTHRLGPVVILHALLNGCSIAAFYATGGG